MNRHITRAQADACAITVRNKLRQFPGNPEDAVHLYDPGHEGDFYALAIEGSGFDTTSTIFDDVTWPPGVFADRVNNCTFSLYPTNVSRETRT